jgi:hypothetical protein
MGGWLKRRLTYANVTATLALVVALAGTSYAALRVGSRQIVDNSVRSADLRNNSVTGRDVRNRSLSGRDIKSKSIGPGQIKEGQLEVLDALRVGGRTLSELIVGCDEPLRAVGAVCIEGSPRPALGFVTANNQCTQIGGRLPQYTELAGSGLVVPVEEWTSEVLAEAGGALTTLVVGPTAVTSVSAETGTRPFRCALPVSNR